ncbi:MAG: hypothetical protein QM758_28305 [Armatimonas sp.]
MKRRQVVALIVFGILAGCSGGGNSPGNVVTRDTEPSLSKDALILAAGIAPGPWVELSTAKQIDADLKAIRTSIPALTAISARGEADPKQVIVTLKTDTAWRSAWNTGTLATGVSAVDSALSSYKAIQVHELSDTSAIYVVSFDQWMNTQKLGEAIKPVDASITNTGVDSYVGDGNDIEVLEVGKKYRFQKGWGDCASGCTSKHYWTVTGAGSEWSVEESGAPLEGAG